MGDMNKNEKAIWDVANSLNDISDRPGVSVEDHNDLLILLLELRTVVLRLQLDREEYERKKNWWRIW